MFHAQFYAEDGRVWFAEAYNLGPWQPLLHTYAGYFGTLPRLGADLALLAPFSLAPLILNLIAALFQALPANLLMSSRSAAWGSFRYRALLVALYLILPNSSAIGAGITESQWLLALSAFLLLVAAPPRSPAGRIFDIAIFLLCGLTGPFCIFLLPIACFIVWKSRSRWPGMALGTLALTAAIQITGLILSRSAARHSPASGASLTWLVRVLSANVYLGALLGSNGAGLIHGVPALIFLAAVAIAGTAIVAVCIVNANREMRLFIAFAAMVFIASLLTPNIRSVGGLSAWEELASTPGYHYWFLPMLAFVWSILWCSHQKAQILKVLSMPLLCVMSIGVIRDWRRPAFTNLNFASYARSFEAAPPGTAFTIPENPSGWIVPLIKHPARVPATGSTAIQPKVASRVAPG